MAKDRLTLYDKYGNERDVDISSEDVTLDNEGRKSLKNKLSEIDEAVGNRITSVTFNGNTPTKDSEGNVNLGQQAQADWGQMLSTYPSYIRNKPTIPTRTSELTNDAGFITASQVPEGSTVDNSMSSTSENAVQNKVIKAYVDAVSQRIDTLIGSGNVQGAIDTFNEVVAFLNGINSSDTLAAKLALKANSADVYTKSQTYSKSEVDAAVAEAQGTQGPKGDTGNVEITDAGDLVTILVNDLTTGGAGNILSAEMGKRLALMSGSFAQAWARSKAIPFPFCFLWNETIDGDAISKPIWHKGNSVFIDAAGAIVNVEAAAVPNAPTITGATGGTEVPKNTQITITPASGSALYYSLDGGATNVSDTAVTIKLGTAGSVSIVAYCANNKGNSSNATLSVTVAGTAVPTFAAKPNSGTTLTQKSGYIEVSRGGYVRISGAADGTLYYSTDGENYTEVQGNNYYDFQIADDDYETTAFVIYAKNKVGNDFSDPVTGTFKMAALAAPTFNHPTGTEFPIGGGSIELTGPAGATMYYTTNGDTPTTASTQYTGAIAVASAMTIKAIAHDTYGDSAVASETFTIAVDHKFQFKIRLTGNNSTEYIPVTNSGGPRYDMTIDWGDETTSTYNQTGTKKSCGHTYTGSAGDEFTITIRGSRCDQLVFGDPDCCNKDALVAILDNSLECDILFNSTTTTSSKGFGPNLASICANALHNNTNPEVIFKDTALTSLPDGLLSHLTKSGVALTSCSQMFCGTSIVFTADQLNELKSAISSVTNFSSMFYGFGGSVNIPDDFFDGCAAGTITSVWALTHTAGSHVTGDAKKLYDSLLTRITEDTDGVRKFALGATGLSNRNQVPTTWGGSMS